MNNKKNYRLNLLIALALLFLLTSCTEKYKIKQELKAICNYSKENKYLNSPLKFEEEMKLIEQFYSFAEKKTPLINEWFKAVSMAHLEKKRELMINGFKEFNLENTANAKCLLDYLYPVETK